MGMNKLDIKLKKAFDTDAFYTYIEEKSSDGSVIMETIIDYCEKNNIDVQLAADVIKRNQKYKKMLLDQAVKLKMVKDAQ